MLLSNSIQSRLNTVPYYKHTFLILTLLLSSLFLFLLSGQLSGASYPYPSDSRPHLWLIANPEGGGEAYSMFHFVVMGLKKTLFRYCMTGEYETLRLIFIIVITGSLIATCFIMRDYLEQKYSNTNPYVLDFAVFTLVIVAGFIIKPSPNFSVLPATGSPNLWHNPTYLFCRPFALLVYIQFFRLYYKYSKGERGNSYIKQMLLLSICAYLCMWAKPSFLMSFLPSVALYLTYELWIKKINLSFYIHIGMALSVSIIALGMIYYNVFEHSTVINSSVTISFASVWLHFAEGIPIPVCILLGGAFPIYMSVVLLKKLTIEHSLMLINLIIAAVIYLVFSETGERQYHPNFVWGYHFALFFLFLVCVEELIFKNTLSGIYKYIAWFLLALHIVSGMYYFMTTFIGLDILNHAGGIN